MWIAVHVKRKLRIFFLINSEDEALLPQHVFFLISDFFARRLVLHQTVANHGGLTLTFFFAYYMKVFTDSLRLASPFLVVCLICERYVDPTIVAFDFRSKCPGERSSTALALCSWERYFILTMHFAIHTLKQVLATVMTVWLNVKGFQSALKLILKDNVF